ncbi:isopenicillin N synthase family oxygenase [Sulfitobacter pseudonitzschiae]|uniref:2-oxoglutarate-dependent ethylene/succinate-forming enzyme n=1 Tax=Pseudosulfitobacter pseudonitzschiae TaxID=1402135 RepID=A0A9Q2RXS6_9RHOB|nr:2OG-Fe(II) oxygenase family protein [Pseudosulfitobacter pseudonitzschiae]MBM2292976.1 isopenicillin N synthase family oxygenase [Pseudosulfitobacter pseudonitzschiae]MBM2297736.1 isopenicillin N synthase family oxygenase [Pseudosulfitobacter pseudonitzschiae]MBM2302650.1 isopenicillin N synthase family oxygenase [Pseudosulfitobacter pseudonitzschiae]MBM2312360.1 isopenicillin N synthase family oxygenase [Pseudosulfitobacter pseudonitzschiae]MBM2317346.1 isopenicillin N synthase family oxyg
MNGTERGDFSEIPKLDVSALYGTDEAAIAATAAEMRGHLETTGFLYVVGHPITTGQIEAVRAMGKRFFALSEDEKAKVQIDKNFRGYLKFAGSTIVTSSVEQVSKPNQSESIFFMHEVAEDDPRAIAGLPLQGPNQWPDAEVLPGFRETIEAYVEAMTVLGRKMASAIAISLGLPADSLNRYFEDPTTFLRLLHYPPQPPEDGLFGSAPHTDYGFITLLAQDDVGGLEVLNKNGDWVAAPPVPGAFVMNVGDILARWSNDLFVSTPHRVINSSGRERYSQPFFFDPSMDETIKVLEPCIGPDGQEKYEPILYRDYLMERIDKNYHYRKKAAEQAT